jgi:hypothetical protein
MLGDEAMLEQIRCRGAGIGVLNQALRDEISEI